MSLVARGITGVAGRYVELTHVRGENETLTRENQKLRAELTEMRRLAEESGRYQRLLGLRDVTPAETIAARVIAVDASPYFRVARVDIDHGEGAVRHGMPVLTPDGVVGRINRVAGKSSDILLLVDPRSAIDVVIPRTGGRGILRGKAGENGYRCSIEYLARGEPAKEGDAVVTSGLGGAFPRNLAVGHDHARSSRAPSACTRTSRSRPTSTSPACPRCWWSSRRRRRPIPRPAAPRAARPRGLMVYHDEIRRHAHRRLPAADPAVDRARAGAGAHGGAQPRPAGRAARGASSKWTISSAAVVSFATGYLFDLVSGAPQGVHAFVFVLMALFARALVDAAWRCRGSCCRRRPPSSPACSPRR